MHGRARSGIRLSGRHEIRAELGLPALALCDDEQSFGDGQRHIRAVVLLDQCKRQIDAGGDSSGGHQGAVANINAVQLDIGLGKSPRQAGRVLPVCRHGLAVDQPGMAERECAGAY